MDVHVELMGADLTEHLVKHGQVTIVSSLCLISLLPLTYSKYLEVIVCKLVLFYQNSFKSSTMVVMFIRIFVTLTILKINIPKSSYFFLMMVMNLII